MREIFRRHKSELNDVDIVVNGRTGLPGANYSRVAEEFLACLKDYRKPRA